MENKLNITLKLEPEHNNAELISPALRVFKCNVLHLTAVARGYELLVGQNAILLQDGDVIVLPVIKLKVSIIKEPNNSLYDMQQGSKHESNILYELGINEASSTIVNKQYTSGKSSFLEQSPLDMLDEYLNFDDDEFKKGELDYAKI